MEEVTIEDYKFEVEHENSLHPNDLDIYRFSTGPLFWATRAENLDAAKGKIRKKVKKNGLDHFNKKL